MTKPQNVVKRTIDQAREILLAQRAALEEKHRADLDAIAQQLTALADAEATINSAFSVATAIVQSAPRPKRQLNRPAQRQLITPAGILRGVRPPDTPTEDDAAIPAGNPDDDVHLRPRLGRSEAGIRKRRAVL